VIVKWDELARTLFEEAGDALFLFDPQNERVLEVNPMAQRLSGFDRTRLLSQPVTFFFRSEQQGGMKQLRRAYAITGLFHSQEGFLLRHQQDGIWVPVNLTVTRLHARPRTLGLITARDISERKRAEQALHDSEVRYRMLFEDNPHPMWVHDAQTLAFLAVNNAAVHHYGYSREEFLGMTLHDLYVGDLSAGAGKHRRKDGTQIEVETAAHALNFGGRQARLVLARDVTERRRLEEELRQAQKLEAVGRLAGGVAHDFNNLLTVITGYSDLLLADLRPDHPHQAAVIEVRKAADRAAALTRQLLTYSRRQTFQPARLDLNGVITELENMLRRLIGEHIELVNELDPEAQIVVADPGQLEQVVVNLVVNARDAMPQGGRIALRTGNVVLGGTDSQPAPDVPAGRYAFLEVADTGCGMDEAIRARIFEPFFTTKEPGKGTGLGLATVYGVVKQARGHIAVQSSPGQGTTFRVYLPAAPELPVELQTATEAADHSGGTETVLLVEDEAGVRQLARMALEHNGYTVLEAAEGKEALDLVARHPGPIDLLLTDVVMPRMTGHELAARLTASRPDVKVLFMSGYNDDALLRQRLLGEPSAFLPKPFSPAVLAGTVRRLLDGTPAIAGD
jgi:two-component system cell cycle sensor histidine kinase/response regulator CckA